MELKNLGIALFWILILVVSILLLYMGAQAVINYSANKFLNALTDNQFSHSPYGNLSIKILPSPRITAKDILVTDPYSKETMLKIKNLYAEVSLLPLFHRDFIIDKIELNDASILIEKKKTGETNWSIFSSKSNAGTKSSAGKLSAENTNEKNPSSPTSSPDSSTVKIIVRSIVITNVQVIYHDLTKNTVTNFQLDKLIVDNDTKQISIIGPIGKYNNLPFNFNFVFSSVTAANNYPFTLHAASGETIVDATGTASTEEISMNLSINSVAGKIDGDIAFKNKTTIKLNLRADSLNIDKLMSAATDKKINATHDKSYWDMKDGTYDYSSDSLPDNWPYILMQSLIGITHADVDFQAKQVVYQGIREKDVNFNANLLHGDLILNPCSPAWLNKMGDVWFSAFSFRNITSTGKAKPVWCKSAP
jgi:hypothetical protein